MSIYDYDNDFNHTFSKCHKFNNICNEKILETKMINLRYAKEFCCEDISKIENYDLAVADRKETWHCHHRLEIVDGIHISMSDLKTKGLYYGRPASELIFLTRTDHLKLHNTGRKFSKVWRQRISEALRGKLSGDKNPNFGRTGDKHPLYGKKVSKELRSRISETEKKDAAIYREYRANGGELKWQQWRKLQKKERNSNVYK